MVMQSGLRTCFYAGATEQDRGAQIDFIIERTDNTIHLCEAKFSSTALRIGSDLRRRFEHKASVFGQFIPAKNQVLNALITTFPPRGDALAHHIDQVITMEDLFSAEPPKFSHR